LLSVDRFALILFPSRPLFDQNRVMLRAPSLIVWNISMLGSVGFFIGQCERTILEDGTFVDVCPLSREGRLRETNF
ncbi:hypothetical protein PENTCL1PPCAC_18755, partial [Pristionchus entomophagus]